MGVRRTLCRYEHELSSLDSVYFLGENAHSPEPKETN